MNFNKKIIFIFLPTIFLSGCGVKTRPKKPAGTSLPSIVEKYKKPSYLEEKKKEEKNKN